MTKYGLTALLLCGALTLAASQSIAAETLKIGVVAPVTGPAAESGRFQVNGAKLAAEEVNKAGGVLGKQLELVIEDDQTTNPGAVLAFSKLAGDSDIPAFIGSIRSTQVHAMAPDVIKTGKPMMIGGTDPKLTHMGNPWLFRFRPNDTYSARVIAEYGVNVLKRKKWAIVHSTDAFGTAGKNALADQLKALGAETVITQGYTNNSQDFTPVALAVKAAGAEILSSYVTFETDQGILAKQMRQLGVDLPWIGSTTISTTSALRLAGPALNGTWGVTDFAEKSSPASEAFSQKYMAAYNTKADVFSAWPYDAVTVLAKAINDAGSTDPEKIRAALMAISGFAGAEGTYDFDQNGDGLHGYNIVHNDNGTIVFERRIDFKD
ncbi:ethanolamine utilization protein EutJ [Skermanella aerolata]|uniref:Ethanolamine utilization protein EutJ n=1 Tax=Skermanella aerolata TaxID=393310 RepID=A0A512DIU8_9PROT|nr:ABC transporter substrate-binding protein [Skermanella aerolata]KJB97425.1 ABC transporter substrate-binding protein [Skermanella aerolata KACC 11604]GEO36376.1 ethanolamine utilization protein EutJ [Skermanella aerolata]